MCGNEIMVETANGIINSANVLTIQGLLAIVSVAAVWYMFHKEKVHEQNLKELRNEHRADLNMVQSKFIASIDKLSEVIDNSNKERVEIRHLLEAMKDFQISVNVALNSYDKLLNEILFKVGGDASCRIDEHVSRHSRNDTTPYGSKWGKYSQKSKPPDSWQRAQTDLTNWAEGE